MAITDIAITKETALVTRETICYSCFYELGFPQFFDLVVPYLYYFAMGFIKAHYKNITSGPLRWFNAKVRPLFSFQLHLDAWDQTFSPKFEEKECTRI